MAPPGYWPEPKLNIIFVLCPATGIMANRNAYKDANTLSPTGKFIL